PIFFAPLVSREGLGDSRAVAGSPAARGHDRPTEELLLEVTLVAVPSAAVAAWLPGPWALAASGRDVDPADRMARRQATTAPVDRLEVAARAGSVGRRTRPRRCSQPHQL